VIIVSHDRYLLDETVTTIVELEDLRLHVWEGNYSAYAVAKEIALLRQQELYVAQQKEIARLEAAIARFKLWASIVVDERHIKQARNKQRQIDRMDKVDRPVLERKQMGLQLKPSQRGGQKALDLRDVGMAFGDHLLLLGLKHTIWSGERVGIVGQNGAGKTVLGRLLTGQLEPTYGEVWRGPSINLGYYAQGHETLDMQATLLETIRSAKPMYEEQATAFLGQFLFPYRMVNQSVGSLSGGERSRLQLARLMLSGANCLILDEPTNHLDIASAEVLEGALAPYSGTIIVISHDRYFLDRVVDRVIEVENGDLSLFDGGYSSYLDQKTRRAAVPSNNGGNVKRPARVPT
jgi:ATP-binding cassette subfamily F protein 3